MTHLKLKVPATLIGAFLFLCPTALGQVTQSVVGNSAVITMEFNHGGGGEIYRTPNSIGFSDSSPASVGDDHTIFEPYGDTNQLLHGVVRANANQNISARSVSATGNLSSMANSIEGEVGAFYGQFSVKSSAASQTVFTITQPMSYYVRCTTSGSAVGAYLAAINLFKDGVRVFDLGIGAYYGGFIPAPPGAKTGVLSPGTYTLTAQTQCQSSLTNTSSVTLDFAFQVNPFEEEPKAHVVFYSLQRTWGHYVGHAFLKLVSKRGEVRYYGFYPLFGLIDSQGIVSNEAVPWDYGLDFAISDEQYRTLSAALTQAMLSPPHYNLQDFNCYDWIIQMAQLIGISLPDATTAGISDPQPFGSLLQTIGAGNTINGGVVIRNLAPNRALPQTKLPSSATPPYLYTYSLTTTQGHTNAAQLAQFIGLAYDPVDLGTVSANTVSGLTVQLSGTDPRLAMISMSWGDASDNQGQALSFTHHYQAGSYQAHLLVIDSGAVHSYSMNVVVSAAAPSAPQIAVAAFPPAGLANDGLSVPLPTDIPDFVLVQPTSMTLLPNGHALSGFKGVPNWTFTIQAGNDLTGFSNIGTAVADSAGNLQFEDPVGTSVPRRFYRAAYP